MGLLPIRPFDKNADKPLVEAFFAQMGGESRSFFNRGGGNEQSTLAFFSQDAGAGRPEAAYFMAEDDCRMAGYVFLWDLDKAVPWLGIAVAEDWKGRHLGRELMEYAADYACGLGKGGILLTTHIANLRGQGLYEASGYEYMGTHTNGERLYLKRF
ncbi:MAG: GNAT family N-acetyltransferase [Defluviitaleaceae bacterium]|nr:GNAT family N-acetyltransferase [Defluviitaleaceae bacterium]